jgi:hypothetical protein
MSCRRVPLDPGILSDIGYGGDAAGKKGPCSITTTELLLHLM